MSPASFTPDVAPDVAAYAAPGQARPADPGEAAPATSPDDSRRHAVLAVQRALDRRDNGGSFGH